MGFSGCDAVAGRAQRVGEQDTACRGAGHSASGSRTQHVGVQHAARRGAAEPSGVWTRHPFLGPSTVSRQASAPACPFVPKWRPSCWFSVWSHKRLEKPLPSSVNLWEELRSSVETQLNAFNYLLIHLRGISQVKATHTRAHTHTTTPNSVGQFLTTIPS